MRELLEQGFEVAVVKDATAAAQVREGNGYAAVVVNFRFMANNVLTTSEPIKAMDQASKEEEDRPAMRTQRERSS